MRNCFISTAVQYNINYKHVKSVKTNKQTNKKHLGLIKLIKLIIQYKQQITQRKCIIENYILRTTLKLSRVITCT